MKRRRPEINPTPDSKWAETKVPKRGRVRTGGARAARFAGLDSEEKGSMNGGIPGNGVNRATDWVNLANALGEGVGDGWVGGGGGWGFCPGDAQALSIPGSVGGDFAAMSGCECAQSD